MALVIEAFELLIISLLLYAAKLMHWKIIDRGVLTKSQLAQLPPGPVAWPVIGCIPEMLGCKSTFRWIHAWMEKMDTDIACFRLGNVHVIPVTCPEMAREFLKKQDAVFASRPLSVATETFSGGYKTTALSPWGEGWKKMRKVLTSAIVSPAMHQRMHDKRAEEANNLMRFIFNQADLNSGIVNLRTACQHYCGNVIRRLMFDRRYFVDRTNDDGAPTYMEEEHVNALFTSLRYLYAFCVSDFLPCLAGLDLDGHEKIVKNVNDTILKYHSPIIKERILKWRENDGRNFKKNKDQLMNRTEPNDFLDVLVSLQDTDGKPLLTPEEITAQTWEIMIATVDNPSNAVEWAMAEIINNPAILAKAVEEVDRVVGKERLVQEHDIPKLNYIKAIARESFRLHPFAPFNVPHMSLSDTVVAGYRIPKGSHVLLSRRGLGRNPTVWDEPLEFRPERHLPKGGENKEDVVLTENDLRFISFSTGRRGCIAANLGTAVTVMLLARMIQGFSWNTPPGITKINLEESECELSLGDPLIACAEPRLAPHLYALAS